MTEKKTDVWMPLWIGAYLADTMAFTTEQHGAYLLLILAYWRERAALPDDDDMLRGITKMDRADWKRVRPVLARKFRVADGVWWHKRVEHEIEAADSRAKKAAEKASKAAQARWQAPAGHSSSNAPSMPQAVLEDVLEECPPPSPKKEISKPTASHPPAGSFPAFWEAWPKSERKQDKAKCADHWKRNGLDAEADQILADIATKAKTTKWQEGFIEAPLVYLRGKRWEDGVTPDGGRPGLQADNRPDAAAVTKALIESRRLTPEEMAASEEARRRVMSALKVVS